jgi:hypothetical protein
MCEDKFDEVVELLKEKYDASDPIVSEIIEMVMDDVFKDYPTDHLGTFAEIKSIDEFNRPPLPDDIISRSSCGWATYDIREAIRRAKEEKANESK